MRKALFGILMAATAATPVAAQEQQGGRANGRAEARAERAQEHYRQAGERNEARAERRQQAETRQVERQQVRQEVREAPDQQQAQAPQPVYTRARQGGNWQRGGQQQVQQQQVRQQSTQRWGGSRDTRRDAMDRQIQESREASRRSAEQTIGGNYARQADRNQARYEDRVREQSRDSSRRDGRYGNDGRYDNDRRDGSRDGRWSDRRDGRGWDGSWRNDRRYDWQRYRYSNRNIFRSSRYYAPYRNYNYNRLSIGLFLDSLFYSNRYWLNDPYQYRLPAAPYGTQWVRYYNDVVLVDVYSGEVIDVIYDFFW